MTRVRISVDAELSEELLAAFPQLTTRVEPRSMITGDVADQQELQGILNFLSSMGIEITEVVTIPD